MNRIIYFLLLSFIGISLRAAVPAFPSDIVFSGGENAGESSWNGIGTIRLTYSAAKRKLDLELRKQGWKLIRHIEYDRIRWKSLEIWSRGEDKILLQYWREDVALTGFSWGILKDEKRS